MNDIHIKLDKLSFITDFIFITYYKKRLQSTYIKVSSDISQIITFTNAVLEDV